MRQVYLAGEALFVDYAGLTLAINDPRTGVVHPGQVFVATLGASDYTYAEVTRTQSSEDWLCSHVRALAFCGGVPETIVPDNLKSGVTHPSRYEPELNRAYAEFAEYYSVAIIPARVRRPKDKAMVEVHVQIIERRLLAPLRDQVYFSVSAANEALRPLLQELNLKPFQKRPGSRFELFTELDQLALRPFQHSPSRSPAGSAPPSGSITTLNWRATTTACRTGTRRLRSICDSRPAWSSCSWTVCGSRCTTGCWTRPARIFGRPP